MGSRSLTRRELEVLNALVAGETAKQTALRWGITDSGVRSTRHNAYRKLGVVNGAQAVVAAYKLMGR